MRDYRKLYYAAIEDLHRIACGTEICETCKVCADCYCVFPSVDLCTHRCTDESCPCFGCDGDKYVHDTEKWRIEDE